MVRLSKDPPQSAKVAQTFFLLDVKTSQPLCFTTASSVTVTQATPPLLQIAAAILEGKKERPLVLADKITPPRSSIRSKPKGSLICLPMPSRAYILDPIKNIPYHQFIRHWAGRQKALRSQRIALRPLPCSFVPHQFFKAFLCTSDRDELEAMTEDYPDRWHIEPFFKNDQCSRNAQSAHSLQDDFSSGR